ncbi:Helix-turn-helix domain-containing protein [Nonomuraea solani]|uniref:Helix-turn-helix domain-containing protein n=1 Tax=Nonomuraea solani TaxID=1144553 RepID=A0A1H6F4Z4_9ACTN|nr:helix-turn-helix domain-containing protein [Nonomuraea solani]SEH04064.1 Helix-turn-helix domain-containing protein [Nonomuraea solani]
MSPRSRGVLRIVFTSEDLALTRMATRTDLLWEMVGSLHRLQARDGGPTMTGWRRQARARLTEAGLLASVRSLLLPLAPKGPYFPDFLTPIEAQLGDEQALQTLADTPGTRIRAEMELLRRTAGLPSTELADLARGNRQAIKRLDRLVTGYCQAVLTPHRPQAEPALAHERALLQRHLVTGGAEQMLAHLSPAMRWRPPVLEVDYPTGLDRQIHLRGRGLTVIPSYFCRGNPVALVDPALPPVLAYPIPRRTAATAAASAAGGEALAALLGRTRAEILSCIVQAPGCSTSELAHRARISPSTASEHVHVLRQANLIASVRQVNLVLHYPTELGADLLAGRPIRGSGSFGGRRNTLAP